MNVTLRHLRAFIEVARRGSFSRAAQELAVSQPALTITINQFEELLGVRLFDRTTRRVILTGNGEEFLPTAERLIDDFEAAISNMRVLAAGRRGRVRAAVLASVAVRLMPPIVTRFIEAYPEVTVQLHDANSSGIQRRVSHGEVDFGLGSFWEADPDLEFAPVMRDPFGLVCREDHPLARERCPLPWSELAGYSLLGLTRNTAIRLTLTGLINLPESVRAPRYEVSNLAALTGLLGAGLGAAALPEITVPQIQSSTFVFRPLVEPKIEREICLIARRGRTLSPTTQNFRDLIIDSIPQKWAFAPRN